MTARATALAVLAASLLSGGVLSGCVEFRPVEASALGEAEPVRVTLTSRREVFVQTPHVVGDSLIGLNEATGARVAVAMAQVARLEARYAPQPDDLTGDGAEATVVTAVGAAGLTLAGALLILLLDLP